MLRTKLFWAFAATAIVVGVLSALFGMRMIRRRVVAEAQTRVNFDLSAAWSVCHSRKEQIETVARIVSSHPSVTGMAREGAWDRAEVRARLQWIRAAFHLDYLSLTDSQGRVVLRAAGSGPVGDYRMADPAVAAALRGEVLSGVQVLSREEMELEASGLADRAFLGYESTPHARPTPKSRETRGLAVTAAAPVKDGATVLGCLYAGVLLNRNADLVDRIHEIVFKGEQYRGSSVGTVTIFLDDCRIATTVRLNNGNRALGTRASKEVSDRVLDNAMPWLGRAFVVRDWYLSAYEPIRDLRGDVAGMLYVGLLERPFVDLGRNAVMRYGLIVLVGLVVALVLAFFYAGRIALPIHRLVEASSRLRHGEPVAPVVARHGCDETSSLVEAFNEMARALAEREARLKETNGELEKANVQLTTTNRSYMETLGFVSHELKSPVATMMNYVYLLRSHLGGLDEKQVKAVRVLDSTLRRVTEMVRHYLNLSRIENAEFQPMFGRVAVRRDVIDPVLETFHPDLEARGIAVENLVPAELALRADQNMTHEVFENLVSNAVKYGRGGGRLRLDARPAGAWVRFTVGNDGAGIPPEKAAVLFQKFSRLDNGAGAPRPRGTGLGLFITRNIVEGHGGTIDVTSGPDGWTEFGFTLPAADAPAG